MFHVKHLSIRNKNILQKSPTILNFFFPRNFTAACIPLFKLHNFHPPKPLTKVVSRETQTGAALIKLRRVTVFKNTALAIALQERRIFCAFSLKQISYVTRETLVRLVVKTTNCVLFGRHMTIGICINHSRGLFNK